MNHILKLVLNLNAISLQNILVVYYCYFTDFSYNLPQEKIIDLSILIRLKHFIFHTDFSSTIFKLSFALRLNILDAKHFEYILFKVCLSIKLTFVVT